MPKVTSSKKASISGTKKMHTKRLNSQNGKESFTFFYTTESPFSQFFPCNFILEELEFTCAEQYMMYQKASKYLFIIFRFVLPILREFFVPLTFFCQFSV